VVRRHIISGAGVDSLCGDRRREEMSGAGWQSNAESLLVERGADRIDHPGGTLLEHVRRVSSILAEWGASDRLRAAGFCHACYGTAGFDAVLLELTDRGLLVECIGQDAESLVYIYASCDRSLVYPRLGELGRLEFSDRFTGVTRSISERDAADLVELTAANELDIAKMNSDFRAQLGKQLIALFHGAQARGRLSERAWDETVKILGEPVKM
jgi:hypothetical protein